MKTITIILGFAVFALLVSTGWQIAACELANAELRDDLKDVASMVGARVGLAAQQSDEELRGTVIRRAAARDITLEPEQIAVERLGTGERLAVSLTVKYPARVWVPGLWLVLHFTASSEG